MKRCEAIAGHPMDEDSAVIVIVFIEPFVKYTSGQARDLSRHVLQTSQGRHC